MNIAVNRTTKELIGYWTPKGRQVGIVVTAYDVTELTNKFDKAVAIYEKILQMHGKDTMSLGKVKIHAQ